MFITGWEVEDHKKFKSNIALKTYFSYFCPCMTCSCLILSERHPPWEEQVSWGLQTGYAEYAPLQAAAVTCQFSCLPLGFSTLDVLVWLLLWHESVKQWKVTAQGLWSVKGGYVSHLHPGIFFTNILIHLLNVCTFQKCKAKSIWFIQSNVQHDTFKQMSDHAWKMFDKAQKDFM